jgi:hypothetical protein
MGGQEPDRHSSIEELCIRMLANENYLTCIKDAVDLGYRKAFEEMQAQVFEYMSDLDKLSTVDAIFYPVLCSRFCGYLEVKLDEEAI